MFNEFNDFNQRFHILILIHELSNLFGRMFAYKKFISKMFFIFFLPHLSTFLTLFLRLWLKKQLVSENKIDDFKFACNVFYRFLTA